MQPPVFHAPPERIHDDLIDLPAAEARHALKVLRLRRHDQVVVIDGLGVAYRGRIGSVKRSGAVTVEVLSVTRNYGEPAVNLTLAAALSTGAKFDTIVQKGTELGVKRFVPLLSEKSRVKLDDPRRAENRRKRLEKVALAAAKQCRRAFRPYVCSPVTFAEFLGETDPASLNLAFHPGPGGAALASVVPDPPPDRAVLLVGPESGFSDTEVQAARSGGYTVVGLGRRILRAETAAPAVCALLMDRLGELT